MAVWEPHKIRKGDVMIKVFGSDPLAVVKAHKLYKRAKGLTCLKNRRISWLEYNEQYDVLLLGRFGKDGNRRYAYTIALADGQFDVYPIGRDGKIGDCIGGLA